MKIVIDANRIIAALIKEGTTREILFKREFEFIAPDCIKGELQKYREEIKKKAKITEEAFDILLSLIFEHVKIVPQSEYETYLHTIADQISDIKDIPYLALASATQAEGIWSHDPHFLGQQKIRILTNIDMLRMSGKANDNL